MIRKCVHNHYSDDSEGPRTCPERKRHSQRLEIGLFADDGEGQRMIANKGSGGRGGIRTHEGLAPLAVFKTAALNHSATLPIAANAREVYLALRVLTQMVTRMVTNIMALIRYVVIGTPDRASPWHRPASSR